ncbi:hypothetical protein [Sabulicella glaciei]|uniref:DUF2207 domain-containing protein n=1 Tax=Sabulicella glaciei TaxID=2984948 RepID=A0ABT3NZJ7_9PROT|nr:hypothetical protein [Roseococcus sp. MDT2-1-1]MCW8087581.1 hypothetical protein [Roseococcus sp. MDT2-1-1]
MEDAPNSFDGTHVSVRRYLEEAVVGRHWEHQQGILLDTVEVLTPGILEEARKRGDPQSAYSLARDATEVVADMDYHLHPRDFNSSKRMRMWWHLRDHVILDPAGSEISEIQRRDLEASVSEYMARPWMWHDYLDWCVIDALVAQEWAAYLQFVRGQRSLRWLVLAVTVALYGLPILGLSYLFSSNSSFTIPALLAYAALVIWGIFGLAYRTVLRLTSKISSPRNLLLAMRDAYASLDGAVLSPSRVRDELRLAAEKGVGWSQVIWPVIDAAVARNPHVWRVAPPPVRAVFRRRS